MGTAAVTVAGAVYMRHLNRLGMSVTRRERDNDGSAVEAVPGHPDLSLAEHLKSVDAEAKAEIDRGWRADMAEEHRQARKKDREEGNRQARKKDREEGNRQALKEERRQALKEERQSAIDWQIMVGNHRDLANVYARSMPLQSY